VCVCVGGGGGGMLWREAFRARVYALLPFYPSLARSLGATTTNRPNWGGTDIQLNDRSTTLSDIYSILTNQ